jgi:Zn-dependent peptidase ImmA (M78 family)/DNA-binding XRE family transcriptional regulator
MSVSTKRVEAAVKPELLVWARESAGLALEEAAQKIQVKPERLASWESGSRRPTINQLRNLGRVYKRPLAVFFLSKPPKKFKAMHDYRRLPGEVAGVASPQLRLEIRRARYRREVALELFRLRGEPAPSFQARARLTEDPEEVAAKARKLLGLSYETQTSFRTAYDALNGWRTALEDSGVLVFQARDVDLAEMRGFSIADQPLPAIVANIKDRPRGRVFTLLHELAHLMLREEGLCDLSEHVSVPPEERRMEVFCNHVAGAILIPRDTLLGEEILQQHGTSPTWHDDELLALARRYEVSQEAMLRRLLILGRTSQKFYQAKRNELVEIYAQQKDDTDSEGRFAPPDRLAVATAGKGFVRLVLDSYYNERITASDLSDFLGVRLKHMSKIEQAVFDRGIEFGVAN